MARKHSTLDCIPSAEQVREELVKTQQKAQALAYLLQVAEEVEQKRTEAPDLNQLQEVTS